jgi:aldehyde dehydrogenase (NAD+)
MVQSSSSSVVDKLPQYVSELRAYYQTHVTKTYHWRITQLQALLRLVKENEDSILNAMTQDLSKPTLEAGMSEVWNISAEIEATIKHLSNWMKPEYVPTPAALLPATSYVQQEPYGVALIIAPFNYPFQLAILPLAASIAAGNVACIKPSELTPTTASLLTTLLPKYLDPRSIRVVEGAIAETSALLKERWDFIFFTGSETVGKIVQKAAAVHLTPTVLELGGKSPNIIHSDASLDLAVRRTIWGKYFNAGQTCIAPDFAFVHNSIKNEFIQRAKKQITAFYTENPKNSKDLARIVSERHTERLASVIDAHKNDIVAGGEYSKKERYVAPTLVDVKDINSAKSMQEEIFGPILPIVGYNDINEVKDYINAHPKPLTLYLFTNSQSVIDDIIVSTSSGAVTVNDTLMHFTNNYLPFGGVGSSGIGSYHGKFGYQAFSHPKPVLVKSVYGDPPLRYPPYTDGKVSMMKTFAGVTITSESLSSFAKYIALPIAAAGLAHYLGLRIHVSLER